MTDYLPLEAPVTEIPALPLQHPGRPIGRDELVKAVYNHLRDNRPVLLYGVDGVGKTTIAAALAAAYTQQPGGVLWLSDASQSFGGLIARIARAYDLYEVAASERPTAHVGAVASALMQHRPLLVLDGVTNMAVMEQFIDKAADNYPIIIISTDELPSTMWEAIEVEPLPVQSGVALFKQKGGVSDNAHDDAIAGIVQIVDGLPLPIVMLARAMAAAKQDATTYRQNLEQVARSTGSGGVTAAVALSFRQLNNALQGLVLMMGATFRGEASAELLQIISGVDAEKLNQAMGLLSQLFFVEKFTRADAPYYRMHPLVYRFARSVLDGKNQLDGLQIKVRDAVLAYVRRYSVTGDADHSKLAIEIDNVLAVANWAEQEGNREIANQLLMLLDGADDFFSDGGYVAESMTLRGTGSGSTTAFPAHDDSDSPEDMLTNLLGADEPDEILDEAEDYDEGDFDDFDEDYDEYDEEDEIDEPVRSGGAQGFVMLDEDETDEEDELAGYDEYDDDFDEYDDEDEDEESLREGMFSSSDYARYDPFAEEDDDEYDEAAYDAGALFTPPAAAESVETEEPAEDAPKSLEEMRFELAQARQDEDVARQIEVLKAIGRDQINAGMETEAIGTYSDLLKLYDEEGTEADRLEVLDLLAALMVKTGNPQAAVMHASQGVVVAQHTGDLATRLNLLLSLGDAHQDLGDSMDAGDAFAQALEIARKTGDTQNEGIALYKLGYAQLDAGETDTAIHTWTQARDLFRRQEKRAYEGRVLSGLGAAYSDMGMWTEAIGYVQSALHIAREVGDKDEEALQLSNLGHAQLEAGKLPEALLSYRQALHMAYEIGTRDDIVSAIVDLVQLMMRSTRLLPICDLLLDDALSFEPNDRDVLQLKEAVTQRIAEAEASGVQFAPVAGTAQDYAANAYALLEQT